MVGSQMMAAPVPAAPAPVAPAPPSIADTRAAQLKALQESYLGTFSPSAEETAAQSQLTTVASETAKQAAAARQAYSQRVGAINEQATLQPFLTGRQAMAGSELANQLAALQASSEAQTMPLSAQLAQMQAQRQAQQQRGAAEIGFATPEAEPTPVNVGGRLVDPRTGQVIYEPPVETETPDYMTVSPGATVFDPVTGKALYTAPRAGAAGGSGVGTTGGGAGGALSDLAKSVYENPALLNNLTPTVKGKILAELAAAGQDVSRFGLQNLGAAQRAEVALFDEIENEANYASTLYDKGVNTGPVAGRLGVLGQKFGTTGEDFTNLKSAIDNMGSILLRMRSGAAVTPQEFERIAGFIPSINEDEATAKTKISRFYQAISDAKQNYITRQTQSTYQITQQPQSGFNQAAPATADCHRQAAHRFRRPHLLLHVPGQTAARSHPAAGHVPHQPPV
jgi:hypothetical protein